MMMLNRCNHSSKRNLWYERLHNLTMIETPIENPEISIVIPVYNEEESLPQLFKELYPVMENLQRSFEIIFINDGVVINHLLCSMIFNKNIQILYVL